MNKDILPYVLVTNNLDAQISFFEWNRRWYFPLIRFGKIFIICMNLVYMNIKYWNVIINEIGDLILKKNPYILLLLNLSSGWIKPSSKRSMFWFFDFGINFTFIILLKIGLVLIIFVIISTAFSIMRIIFTTIISMRILCFSIVK